MASPLTWRPVLYPAHALRPACPVQAHPLVLVAWLLVACGGNPYFQDDEGGHPPGGCLLGPRPDRLSLPYASGARVRITVYGDEARDPVGWQLVSDQPAVFRVDGMALEGTYLVADCTALAEGEARLRLLDDGGRERRNARVRVVAPDRLRWLAHGPLRILGRDEAALPSAEVQQARVLIGGTGVFAVAYFRDQERVYGRGLLTSEAPGEVRVEHRTTSGLPTNEWLFFTPQAEGTYMVALRTAGRTLATVPVVGVPERTIARLALVQQRGEPRDGQTVWVLAQASDAAGHDIHGVYSNWTLDGVLQKDREGREATGDLYRFQFARSASLRQLTASRGPHQASLSVRAHEGQVVNTTYLGCGVASGPGASAGALLPLVLLLASGLRRTASARVSGAWCCLPARGRPMG